MSQEDCPIELGLLVDIELIAAHGAAAMEDPASHMLATNREGKDKPANVLGDEDDTDAVCEQHNRFHLQALVLALLRLADD